MKVDWHRGLRGFRTFAFLGAFLLVISALPVRGEIIFSDYSTAHPLKVLAIGDSITDDCSLNGAWRLYLQPLLETNGYAFTFVGRQASAPASKFTKTRHEGYCGAVIAAPGVLTTSVHGYSGPNVYLQKIIKDALTNLSPDLVLVMMGANDIGRGRDPHKVATNDLPALIDLIFSNAPNANIILNSALTLSNAVFGYATNAAKVPVYNAALQRMVNDRRAAGQNLFLADLFSRVDYSTMFMGDHLHPNQKGLAAIAREYFTKIQTITLRTNPVVTTLVTAGAEWKYSDGGQAPGTNWMGLEYDDLAWSQGPARLGHGDPRVATTFSYGPDPTHMYPTTYFRRPFVVPDNIEFTNLSFRVSAMDGVAVWLNGQELFRRNLPDGSMSFTNVALTPVNGEAAYLFNATNFKVPVLPTGTNIVAVELHIASPNNATAGFDLELLATGYAVPPPSISVTMRGNGVFLSWPQPSKSSYDLYSNTNLLDSGSWMPVNASLIQTNGTSVEANFLPDPAPSFFRLRKR